MSAEVPPEALYTEGPLAHEFPRTVSRLNEMQSAEFLALERRDGRHRADMKQLAASALALLLPACALLATAARSAERRRARAHRSASARGRAALRRSEQRACYAAVRRQRLRRADARASGGPRCADLRRQELALDDAERKRRAAPSAGAIRAARRSSARRRSGTRAPGRAAAPAARRPPRARRPATAARAPDRGAAARGAQPQAAAATASDARRTTGSADCAKPSAQARSARAKSARSALPVPRPPARRAGAGVERAAAALRPQRLELDAPAPATGCRRRRARAGAPCSTSNSLASRGGSACSDGAEFLGREVVPQAVAAGQQRVAEPRAGSMWRSVSGGSLLRAQAAGEQVRLRVVLASSSVISPRRPGAARRSGRWCA